MRLHVDPIRLHLNAGTHLPQCPTAGFLHLRFPSWPIIIQDEEKTRDELGLIIL